MKKRIAAVFITLAMVLSFAACGGANGPETPVKAFIEGMKNWDPKAMTAATTDTEVTEDPFGQITEDQKVVVDFFAKYAKEISYTIKETKTEGDTAKVTVDFKYKDISSTIKVGISNLFVEAMKQATSGGDFSNSDAMALFGKCLEEAEKTAAPTDATATVTFSCKKVGNDWKVSEAPDDLINVWLSNGMSALSGLTGN